MNERPDKPPEGSQKKSFDGPVEPVTGRLRVEVLQIVPHPEAEPGVPGALADIRIGATVWRNAPVGDTRALEGPRAVFCFFSLADFDAEASGSWGERGTRPPKDPAGQAALWNRVQRAVAEAYLRAEAEGRINTGSPAPGGRAEA